MFLAPKADSAGSVPTLRRPLRRRTDEPIERVSRNERVETNSKYADRSQCSAEPVRRKPRPV